MPVKIKRTRRRLIALTFAERAKPYFFKTLASKLPRIVIATIKKGRSPVQNGGNYPKNTGGKARFVKYSDSYKKQIRRGSVENKSGTEVNLTQTGTMLRSLKGRRGDDYYKMSFTDEKAEYHDRQGAGKKRVIRRMLPDATQWEDFNAQIRKFLVNALKKAVKLSKR